MKKAISIILFASTLMLFILSSCAFLDESNKDGLNLIPEQGITYTNFVVGNVIQDGKQAIFFNFVSDYVVTKIEIAGTLLDKDGNVLHSFETSMTLDTPSYNPELPIRLEVGLVKQVRSVSFTKIDAYTTQSIDVNDGDEVKHLATLGSSDIENYYASGSTITVTNGKISIQLDNNHSSCGFIWDLSNLNLKANTKYIVKFENISVADVNNQGVQLQASWVDSTYTWPKYYNVKGKCFNIISSGQISSDYYQFIDSKTYDEYTMEFSFNHNVNSAKNKNLYFDISGVKGQLLIGKISLYEVIIEE